MKRDLWGAAYRHALCLHPYYRDSQSGSLGLAVFPPTGLEYIAAALQAHVARISLSDLRIAGRLGNPERLKKRSSLSGIDQVAI